MFKTQKIDGVDHLVVLERSSDDGGLIVCYLSEDATGADLSKREWFQDPSLAQAVYDAADEPTLKAKRAEAINMFVPKIAATPKE